MSSDRDADGISASSFAPGHVTGIFAPRLLDRDPRKRGSVGAGLVLELGVHATARWQPGGPDEFVLQSTPRIATPISNDVANRLKGDRVGRLTVRLSHELPVGQGFGMSAAGALATALAVSKALGSLRAPAIEVAHLADLFGGGGLGGVSAILGGGLEVRTTPGLPPAGRIRRSRFPHPVFVAVAGKPLPSPRLLHNPRFLQHVESAAADGLASLDRRSNARDFLAASEQFTDRLALAPAGLRRHILSLIHI